MLIPKCCKGCAGRKSGMCNCTLPSICNYWAEEDETYPNTPNTPKVIKYIKIIEGTHPENEKDWAECPNCKDKDHRIAVLEKALEMVCEKYARFSVPMYSIEYLKLYHIEKAEKELEGKE